MKTFVEGRAVVRGLVWMLLMGLAWSGPMSGRPWPAGLGGVACVGAQETAPADAKSGDAKSPKKRAEPRGRLPAYFGEVVSNDQRDKIYEIQAKYLAQIAKLQDEIALLETTREKDVLAVLSPEQLGKVKQLQEDAKTKRAATAARKKAADAPPASGGEGGR